MADRNLSQALGEAFGWTPVVKSTVKHTLEILNPTFDAPIRVVCDFGDGAAPPDVGGGAARAFLEAMEPEARAMVGLVARLERDAPKDGGATVAFVALPFELDVPDNASAEIRLTMHGVGREISDAMKGAAASGRDTTAIYRPYLSTNLRTPQMNPPLVMALRNIDATPTRVTARANVTDRPIWSMDRVRRFLGGAK